MIEEQTEQLFTLYAHDFTILWWCVNGRYKKQFPDCDLKDMKTDAFIGVLMCRFLVEHNKRMDKLETCLDAYCGNQVIECDDNINACMKILEKNINEIDFEVDDREPGI